MACCIFLNQRWVNESTTKTSLAHRIYLDQSLRTPIRATTVTRPNLLNRPGGYSVISRFLLMRFFSALFYAQSTERLIVSMLSKLFAWPPFLPFVPLLLA